MLGKSDFVFLMKAQITRNKIIFPKMFFENYARTSTRGSLQYFIWLKSKTVRIYLVVKSVTIFLALSIVCNAHSSFIFDRGYLHLVKVLLIVY